VCDDDCGADGKAVRYDGICLALLVEVSRECPGRGVGVVGLDGCAAPRSVAVGVGEKLLIAGDDRDHDCIVDEPTKNCAVDLRHEHDPRGNLDCG
jgi:hypothetical protein